MHIYISSPLNIRTSMIVQKVSIAGSVQFLAYHLLTFLLFLLLNQYFWNPFISLFVTRLRISRSSHSLDRHPLLPYRSKKLCSLPPVGSLSAGVPCCQGVYTRRWPLCHWLCDFPAVGYKFDWRVDILETYMFQCSTHIESPWAAIFIVLQGI